MKLLLVLILSMPCMAFAASENFECEFVGPNYNLSIQANGVITLSNNFKSYECKKGYVNLPGTEAQLSVLNCSGQNRKISFFANENAEGDIILSEGLLFSKDIVCKKL